MEDEVAVTSVARPLKKPPDEDETEAVDEDVEGVGAGAGTGTGNTGGTIMGCIGACTGPNPLLG